MVSSSISRQISQLVSQSQKILINIHVGADYDSVGSALGLKSILDKMGKKVDVYSPETISSEMSQHSDMFPGINTTISGNFLDLITSGYDLFICLDSETPRRISRFEDITFPLTIPTLVIDHHEHNIGFGNINLIIPKNTCTSELVYFVAKNLNWDIPENAALCLFIGLWSDTGQFMFEGTVSSQSYKTAADLIDIGEIDIANILWHLKSTDDKIVCAAGEIMGKATRHFSGKVIVTEFTLKDLLRHKIDLFSNNTVKDFIAFNLSYTKTILIVAIIYEKENGWFKISLRSNNLSDLRDISLIAQKFPHGGGHPRAAGYDSKLPPNQIKKELLQKISETFPDLGSP